ncbi:hypothetical protein [Chryseobacterium sp. CH1]|uniref:hypothetical protein n=1 Tax=Chryseobacterium sp. CH1 TaxID=713551 RepID=UPI00100A4589|nr:hypothetical protein [Chryseobacterium sp. CH1]RXM49919.1 hypothetical protein BOQ64_20545 [Chryseobacterium sp. CH25]RXM62836.1 hypothetical protein BOQ60_18305 [Chryseobacterium sp. CH1]
MNDVGKTQRRKEIKKDAVVRRKKIKDFQQELRLFFATNARISFYLRILMAIIKRCTILSQIKSLRLKTALY